ncbi:transporter substrate-binding domain-containing protein [Pseudomonas sp. L-22-4S-12]|uniref:substrate-binding periplasmic protein n=1 Tax=Pseudomonas sp. L-22-4S-12 TaxID=2610893 RepID=UPI001321B473|nr:transporter substrate-binding domain-containing protein [Pseudomonas sp. L-22-4S-12]MWV17242.1 transporter substrate-binding domain-containing protein [Pseudomonas sp. L-22-4S-12]
MSQVRWWLIGLLLCGGLQAAELRVCQHDAGRYAYRLELVRLVLERTAASHGELHVAPAEGVDPPQERCLAQLRSGMVDLAYVPPSAERLRDLSMIPFDLHAGMLGYRLLLIRREDAPRFARVKTLDDLRPLRGGFGSQWGDFPLFALNRLPVVGSSHPENLLAMLAEGRFDYYHRALSEAWEEVGDHPERHPELMVEPGLALVYPLPVYFAFNRAEPELRQRFEEGLTLIQADGSFRELFQRHFGEQVRRSQLTQRRLLILQSDLPAGLPAADSRFWLRP